jgi:hypothetical protein
MIANRWGIGIMQSLPIFIVELQTAKRELLKNFELPDDFGSHRNATQGAQGCEEQPICNPKPWGRYQIRRDAAWMSAKARSVCQRARPMASI